MSDVDSSAYRLTRGFSSSCSCFLSASSTSYSSSLCIIRKGSSSCCVSGSSSVTYSCIYSYSTQQSIKTILPTEKGSLSRFGSGIRGRIRDSDRDAISKNKEKCTPYRHGVLIDIIFVTHRHSECMVVFMNSTIYLLNWYVVFRRFCMTHFFGVAEAGHNILVWIRHPETESFTILFMML